MDQSAVLPNDGGAMQTMMVILANIPPPQDSVAAQPMGAAPIPMADTVETPPFGQPHQLQDAPPAMQDSEPSKAIDAADAKQVALHPPPDLAAPKPEAKASPEQAQMSAPLLAAPNMKEAVFLARIAPDLQMTQPIALAAAPPQMTEALVAIVTPMVAAVSKIRATTNGEAVPPRTADDPQVAPPMATAPAGPPFDEVQALLLPVVKVKPSDDLAAAGPQMVAPTPVDRAVSAPAPAPVALPVSVPASLIAHASAAELDSVEVVLDPKELGKVRFEIQHHGDQLRVFLAVERPETLDMLRRNADQLVQEFRAAGYAGASLNFGQWGGQKSGAAAHSGRTKSELPADDLSSPSVLTRNFAPTQGLNLRL